jgi:hypothetical protein
MKEAVKVDLDGYLVEPPDAEHVPLDSNGVTEIYEPQETDPEEAPELVLTGYRVSIPRPPGLRLYKPRFDLVAWEAYKARVAAMQDALMLWLQTPEDERDPIPPIATPDNPGDPSDCWVEGLTQAELDEIANRPPYVDPVTQKINQLESESVDTMIALTEVYETNAVQDAQREQEGVDTMLALTEAYELILQQQATIEALTARIAALETGGGS